MWKTPGSRTGLKNKTSDVEYEDDVISEVPSGQHSISIDPSQSVQLIFRFPF